LLLNDIIFDCLGCQKDLVAPQGYIGKKVRCDSCNLAMMVPAKGEQATFVSNSSNDLLIDVTAVDKVGDSSANGFKEEQAELDKLPRIETKKNMNVKKLRESVKASKQEDLKKISRDTILTEEEMLQTQEVEALSHFSVYADYSESEVANINDDNSSSKNNLFIDDLPEITDNPTGEEIFRNLDPEEQTYLKPIKIQASKTIRGGKRPPRVVEHKKKVSVKILLILFILFITTAAWYFMNKDTGEFIRDVETTLYN